MRLIWRLLCIILSVVLALLAYNYFYNATIDTTLEQKIGDYLKQDVVLTRLDSINKHYIQRFDFVNNFENYTGFIILEQGLNNNYRLGHAFYQPNLGKLNFKEFSLDGDHYLAIYGYLNNAESIKIETIFDPIELKIISDNVYVVHTNTHDRKFCHRLLCHKSK